MLRCRPSAVWLRSNRHDARYKANGSIRRPSVVSSPSTSRPLVSIAKHRQPYHIITTARANSRYLGRQKWLSTATNQAKPVAHTPPFAVRTALVATATAVGTPAFPVVGTLNLAFRWILWDGKSRYAVLGATTVVGGVVTLLTMAAKDWMPFVYSYSQLFLPFAVANGALAGTAYAALDYAFGAAYIARAPWTGAVLGGFVGFFGPVTGIYDSTFQWFYEIPEAKGWINSFLTNGFILPVSVTTGIAVGAMMHPLLYFPIVGVQNIHWAKFSAPILAGGTLLMWFLYHGDYFNDDIFPPETYLTTDEKNYMMLMVRFHPKHLKAEDWGSRTGYRSLGTGANVRESARNKLTEVTAEGNKRTDMLFDSRRKAWLHYVTQGVIGKDFAIDSVPTENDIRRTSSRLIPGDGATAFVLLQGGRRHGPSDDDAGIAVAREGLTRLANDVGYDANRAAKMVRQVELASYGVALLFTELYKDKENAKMGKQYGNERRLRQLEKLERAIRRIAPGILLYRQDEGEGYEGCSVEAQLEQYGWDGVVDDELRRNLWTKWKAGYERREKEVLVNQLLWAVTGLSLAAMYAIFGANN